MATILFQIMFWCGCILLPGLVLIGLCRDWRRDVKEKDYDRFNDGWMDDL